MAESSLPSGFAYRAFISYSHRDKRWADWLHRALETWRVPSRLVGRQTAGGTITPRLNPIFRDREELASATDLGRKVNEALSRSQNLIVICSPASAASRWVNEEVLAYKRMGRVDRVFCLIVGGEPDATEMPGRESEECFCPALRFQLDANGQLTSERTEPIAADVRPGKDGKANAKLKLIAGMLDVGFDALKQREQRRQLRRTTAIAAASLAGMLVMSVLLAFAVHARNQAELQRQQAESLIGFMLGNLRDKLEAVDRLDILDDVAGHAMSYFKAEPDDSGSDSEIKRAQTFLLLGRVRFDQGKMPEATRAFDAALRIAEPIYASGTHTADAARTVIDGNFWLGTASWQAGLTDTAMMHFRAALPIVRQLVASRPGDGEALQRLIWTDENIGHIDEGAGNVREAFDKYSEALRVSQRLATLRPRDPDYQHEIATAEDDLAELQYSQGDLAESERTYLAEYGVLARLHARDPRDRNTESALAVAQTYLAQVAQALGHAPLALNNLRSAVEIGTAALASDPTNIEKMGDLASYCRRLARSERFGGNADAATPLLARATALYARMLAASPQNMRARHGLAATELEQADLAWQMHEADAAHSHAVGASAAFSALRRVQNEAHDASIGVAAAGALIGKMEIAQRHADAARTSWLTALETLPVAAGEHDPDVLSLRAELLTLLGRQAEARPLVAQLDAMRYLDPSYVAWRGPGLSTGAALARKNASGISRPEFPLATAKPAKR